MNRIYSLIWSAARAQLVPVSEGTRARRPRGRSRRSVLRSRALACSLPGLICAASALLAPVTALAGPGGARVVAGAGTITQSGGTTTVHQSSQSLSLTWQTFNIGPGETVDFVQPGSSSIAVNRVIGGQPSEILGHLIANGQVWLINPSGILFGKGSQVDVGSLVASTLDLNPNGTAAASSFSGQSAAAVVNQGSITAASGGYVALLASRVDNEGVVSARLGTVAIGAGSAATLTFSGNHLLAVEVDASTLKSLAANHGLIAADGGTVYMTAGAKNSLLASTVNSTGVIRAQSVESHDGTIVLSAGQSNGAVSVAGTVDASGPHGTGGTVTVTGSQVSVAANTSVNASGQSGGGSIRIGGGWEGGEGLPQAKTVNVAQSAVLDASATGKGNGGEVVVRANVDDPQSTASVHGTLLATAGPSGGNGGRIETSGYSLNVDAITAKAAAPQGQAGEWLLDPYNVTIGATGSSVGGGSYVPTADSTITASSISSALSAGSSVTITTGTSGGSIGDIQVNSPIVKSSGNSDVTLTLQAADSVIVNQPITNTGGTGKLNVDLYADNNNGSHDGVGIVILNSSISTGGGSINFGTGSTMTVNGAANTMVGGDVYVGGSSAVNLTTAGGAVALNGQLILANAQGLNVDTTNGASSAGNVTFAGAIDSGDTYALITSDGNVTWNQALAYAKSGVGAAVGDTYLATITSRLENAVASYDAQYQQSWLGAERVFNIGTDNVWRWVGGPEGLQNNGQGLPFFTQNGCLTGTCNSNGYNGAGGMNSGTAIGGAYTNWNPGTPEPNNYNGTNLSQSGSGEWTLQFVGTQGQWNDLNPTNNHLPFVKETNLAPSPLTVSAGTTGTVTFGGAIGQNKPLSTLTVTGQILGLNSNSTQIATSGPITLNGQVQINNVDYNVLIVSAPSLTTNYGAALSLPSATYSGFKNGDTVSSLTQQATVSTSGATNCVCSAPITASGAVDPNYYIIYNPGTLVVDPAQLTVTGTTVTTRPYDGATDATLSGGVLAGVVGSDATNLTLSESGVFTSPNAGANIPVSVSAILGGSAAGNYTLVQPTGVTGTITPAPLTATGTSVTAKTYDGTTAATLTGGNLSGVIFGSDASHLTLTQSGTFASPDAGSGIVVTASDTLGGSAAGNYALAQPTGLSGTINPAALTVLGSSVLSKTYDGTTAAALTGGSLQGVIGSDALNLTLTQSGTFASANVGTGIGVTAADTLGGSAAGNYTLTQPTGLTGTIDPASLTVLGTSVTSKTYDGTTAATLTGGTLQGVFGSDAANLTLAQGGTFASANAGSGIGVTASDALGGSAAANYTLSQPTGLSGTIGPAQVTVGAGASALSKTYDGTTAAALSGAVLSGVLPADAAGVSLQGRYVSADAGSGIAVDLSLSGGSSGNYVLANPPALRGNIDPAPLLATADPALLPVGGTVPTLSGSFSGFVDGQTLTSLTASGYNASWSTAANGSSAAGQYAIVGSFNDPNYAVAQGAGNAQALTAKVVSHPTSSSSGALLTTALPSPAGSGNSGSAGAGLLGAPDAGQTLLASAADAVDATGASAGASAAGPGSAGGATAPAGSGPSSAQGPAGEAGASSASGGSAASGMSGGGESGAPGQSKRDAQGSEKARVSPLGGRRLVVINDGVNSSAIAGAVYRTAH